MVPTVLVTTEGGPAPWVRSIGIHGKQDPRVSVLSPAESNLEIIEYLTRRISDVGQHWVVGPSTPASSVRTTRGPKEPSS